MSDLFTIPNNLEILEIKYSDFLRETDAYVAAKLLIKQHEGMYPDIDNWFNKKVLPEIKFNERAVYLGLNNSIPIATAVVKRGEDSKFCHLHIEKELRHKNLGDILFILMSVYVKRYAKTVHFSLPEGLWEEKKNFFTSFGFETVHKYKEQYRNGEQELTSSVSFDVLWNKIKNKIPDLVSQFQAHPDSPLNGVVLTIHPEHSKQIFDGKKSIEIRRKFNSKWKNHIAIIYSSSPVQEILGYATIKNVIEDKPEIIWQEHSEKIGCTKHEFDGYTKGAEKVFAIFLSELDKFHNNLSLNYLSNFLENKITPPQSYSSVKDTEWKNAISIAEILHGRFNVFTQEY